MIGWALLVVGAVVAASGEVAAVSAAAVRRVDLYRWAAGHLPGAGAASTILAAPGRILRTARGLVTSGVILCALGMAQIMRDLPLPLAAGALLLVAVPVLLGGVYAVPRVVGRRWPVGTVRRTVPWLRRLATVFAPFFPGAAEPGTPTALAARLRAKDAEESLDQDHLPLLSEVLLFTERPIREVMTPRTEIVAVQEGATLEDVGRVFADSGYSRIPIYRESLDNIVGMIYAFDLLKVAPGAELPLRSIASAPGSKACADLLSEMQRERRQLAVVLDEYGGTAGIVTFEDLLEELVGEIFEEHGAGRAGRSEDSPAVGLLEASGGTPLADVTAQYGVALPEEAETIGGLLARAAGRIPRTGERFVMAGLEFDVLAATPTRLERVLIRRGPVPSVSLERGELP